MEKKNSTKTRVEPLFNYIGKDIDKTNKLLSIFDKKISISSSIEKCNYGKEEMAIPPNKDLLIWCINNPDKLKRKETFEKRCKFFQKDEKTINEALKKLTKEKLPQKAWYIFEGPTKPDIYIETNDQIFVGEAKRTEPNLTKSTDWLADRDQLIRHIDAVIDLGKKVYSFFIVEDATKYDFSIYSDFCYFKKSLPHRTDDMVQKIMGTFLGVITWEQVNQTFNNQIPYIDKIN